MVVIDVWCNYFFNIASAHLTMPPLIYVDFFRVVGQTSVWQIFLGNQTIVDDSDTCTMAITEYLKYFHTYIL